MKITEIKVINKHIIDGSTALIEVHTDEGITGIGSTSAPIPVITSLIEIGSTSFRSLLIGEDATNINRLWHKMYVLWQSQRGRGGEGGIAVNAMGAVDMALWDIAGKAQNVPIYMLLGGAVQSQVMVYASTSRMNRGKNGNVWGESNSKTPDQMAQESKEHVTNGFKAIKFGWGNYFGSNGEEALHAIREAIGPNIHLMLDFGCPEYFTEGWNVKDAIRVAKLLDKYDIFFLEEPLNPYDVNGFAALTRESPIKIATGESLTTIGDFQTFIERRAVDILQPDAQQMGITQFHRVAQRSEETGILCIPHCPWTVMAVASHLNVLATNRQGVMIEYPGFASFEIGSAVQKRVSTMHSEIVETPLRLVDGYLQLPESPGLGLGNYVPSTISELTGLQNY